MKNRIRECRLALGMSQAELGNQVGFADNTISNYEKGLREPTLEVWECLASTLHVSPAYLVGWSDEPNDDKAWQFRQEERRKFKAWVKEHIANEPKMKIDVPDHGLKYTLDDGRVFYAEDIDELDAIREASVGKFICMGNGYIETSHIVSIEKVEEDN